MQNKKHYWLITLIVIIFGLTFSIEIYDYLIRSFSSVNTATKKININKQQIALPLLASKTTQQKINTVAPTPSYRLPSPSNNRCLISPLENITFTKRTNISSDGVIHHKTVKKYYELTTNLNDGSEYFINQLTQKLDATFLHLENMLGITLNKTIPLNFIFQTTRTGYENYLSALQLSAEGNQGMYIYPNNIAVIEVKNTQQALNTATHEAIHAFNRAYLGETFNFFNEGMAEYFKSITATGTFPPFDFSWLTHQQYPYQVSTLLFSEIDWHSNQASDLYQNSKALFYFLMSNQNGRKVIWAIIQREMTDPCVILSKDTVNKILTDTYENHQPEFDEWFKSGLYHFLNEK